MSLRMSHTLENLQQRLESRFGEAILAAVIEIGRAHV